MRFWSMCDPCDPNRRLMGFSLGYSHAPVYAMPHNFTATAGGKLECWVFHDCKSNVLTMLLESCRIILVMLKS